jgi:hypothetical protein
MRSLGEKGSCWLEAELGPQVPPSQVGTPSFGSSTASD